MDDISNLPSRYFETHVLNISMKGRDQTVRLSEKLTAFKGKFMLWKSKIKTGKTASFPILNTHLEDEAFSLTQVQRIIVGHISKLIIEFDHYISKNVMKDTWVRNSFGIEAELLPDETANISILQEQLTEVQNDETLHFDFIRQNESPSSFWIKVYKEKAILRREALKVLLPFATTFLC